MSSIKRTGAQPPPTATQRRAISSCGPTTPTERAVSSCGGWVSKSTRGGKAEKAEKTEKKSNTAVGCGWGTQKRNTATVSSCGGAGWSRYGKTPSGC